jgi:large subunit ribosomal protein L35
MPKCKTHKGLLKRVRVTRTGKIKLRRTYGRHLRSHKAAKLIRKYRRARYISGGADLRKLRILLHLPVNRRQPRRPQTAVAAAPD